MAPVLTRLAMDADPQIAGAARSHLCRFYEGPDPVRML